MGMVGDDDQPRGDHVPRPGASPAGCYSRPASGPAPGKGEHSAPASRFQDRKRPGPHRGRRRAPMSTPGRPVHRRPFLRALAISLLVHAALVGWLLHALETTPAGPRLRPATRITLRPLPPRPPVKDHHRPPSPPPPQ